MTNIFPPCACVAEKIQGFDAWRLGNGAVELTVVPELGAKIVSLKNLKTKREWLWHPGDAPALFRNKSSDSFSKSTLVGLDECFPTVASSKLGERVLPDHGEVWCAPWSVDADALGRGVIRTSVRLAVSPFRLTRTIEMEGGSGCISLSYKLENLGAEKEGYLWALHPLMRLQAGDCLELPKSTRALIADENVDENGNGNGNGKAAWIDALDTAIPTGGCAKVFVRGVREGRVAVANRVTGDRLEMAWDVAQNDSLALWISRGGWNGHHHFAFEATNGSPDTLAEAIERNHCGKIPAAGIAEWSVRLRVG